MWEAKWDKISYGKGMSVRDVNKKRFWLHRIQSQMTIFVHSVGDPNTDTGLNALTFHPEKLYNHLSDGLSLVLRIQDYIVS